MSKMKFFLFIILMAANNISFAQSAISFDSLQFQFSFLTQDAIYFNSNKLIKADYSGRVIWSKSGNITGQAIKVEENGLYIFGNSTLTKLDTAGNLLWSKDFTQPVCSISTLPNTIVDIVVNKNRIFVLSNQQPPNLSPEYPSLITLDTSGTLMHVWCGEYYEGIRFRKGTKGINGGAWVTMEDGGTVHVSSSFQVDSTGNINTNTNTKIFQSGQFASVQSAMQNKSSAHYYLVNSYTPGGPGYTYLINESDSGNTFQYKGFETPSIPFGIIIMTGAVDDSDNVYILALGTSNDIVLLKTNSIGTILQSKMWSDAILNVYQLDFPFYGDFVTMIYRNDSLYITGTIYGKTSVLAFDDSMNSTCYSPDLNLPITDYPNLITGQLTLPYPGINVSNLTALSPSFVQNTSQIHGHNMCYSNSTNNHPQEVEIDIFPNPCNSLLNINTYGKSLNFNLANLQGMQIQLTSASLNGILKLNTSAISNGLYVLNGRIGDEYFRKIISVQH